MQQRHLDRQSYFNELAETSRDYYINYLERFIDLREGLRVLEIGCGEGGNLLPFAEKGCQVTGIDRSSKRIAQASEFFALAGYEGVFTVIDFFEMKASDHIGLYDIILVHDVIEHINKNQKDFFVQHVAEFISQSGFVFWGFPPWQMPFGGHQQICHNKLGSLLPFIHLLPVSIYRSLLKTLGESQSCIDELVDIKSCQITIEAFEALIWQSNYKVINKIFWLINPHYKQKFKLEPRRLWPFIANRKYVRNFFCTSCFYVTQYSKINQP